MELYREFFKLIGELNKEDVPYAVVGGIAMAFYDIPRFTKDIDIIGRPSYMGKYASIFKKLGYIEPADPWTFNNTNITLHRSDLIQMKRLRNSDQDKVDIRRLQNESNRESFEGN